MPQSARRLKFPIDHIIAEQHHGKTELDNLALSCGRCNRNKGPNLSGIDPLTGAIVRLFHPRQDPWRDHFRWNGAIIEGTTEIGRATVDVLAMNHPEEVAVRRELIESGHFPPPDEMPA
jgi:hypothetical protein